MHYMKMTGNEVFNHAVLCMCDAAQKALEKSVVTVDDIDWVIPHQANIPALFCAKLIHPPSIHPEIERKTIRSLKTNGPLN